MRLCLFAGLAFLISSPVVAQKGKPLFEANDTIHIVIKGPIPSIVKTRSETLLPGTLTDPSGQVLPVSLSARGITRKAGDVCDFPPIRVVFTRPPPPTSTFAGQHKLKLVTHCRNGVSFQQYLLTEFAAYHLLNVLTPQSFRVRLANVDYVADDGRPIISRLGFFLEDTSDLAKRNGMKEIHAPDRIPVATLNAAAAARYAMFQHMIGNHDWSMRAGPAGEDCCHNAKLIGSSGIAAGAVIPVPYDFDFSGMVSAPYATPPDELHISDVHQRVYRGYCIHNAQAAEAAREFRAAKPQMMAALASTPQIDPRTVSRAQNYLEQFFALIATDADTNAKVLKRCVS